MAFCGLTEKFNGGAAVSSVMYTEKGANLDVVDGGSLLLYAEKEIDRILVNGEEAAFSAETGGFVTVPLKTGSMVVIELKKGE